MCGMTTRLKQLGNGKIECRSIERPLIALELSGIDLKTMVLHKWQSTAQILLLLKLSIMPSIVLPKKQPANHHHHHHRLSSIQW